MDATWDETNRRLGGAKNEEYRSTMEMDEARREMNERLEIESCYKYGTHKTHDKGIE